MMENTKLNYIRTFTAGKVDLYLLLIYATQAKETYYYFKDFLRIYSKSIDSKEIIELAEKSIVREKEYFEICLSSIKKYYPDYNKDKELLKDLI